LEGRDVRHQDRPGHHGQTRGQVLAPWGLGFTGVAAALWAHVVFGILIAAIAAWELWQVRHSPHAMV
jgi:hypothetical protein